MARQKQATPLRREPSDLVQRSNGALDKHVVQKADELVAAAAVNSSDDNQPGLPQLIVCAGGIYATFLFWAFLQERITTTRHGPAYAPERFTFSIFLNTVQGIFAAITGYVYMISTAPAGSPGRQIIPSRAILPHLVLIAVCGSLASPFGYASLNHIDYVTFILAKSCKLLPVMFLHITWFRRRYPLYKYAVVAAVTLGVATFTLHHPTSSKKRAKVNGGGNTSFGLLLLGINLFFDGITNSTQDHIFQTFRPFSGPQMMCAQNMMSSLFNVGYLLLSPFIAQTALGSFFRISSSGGGELREALAFVQKYPSAGWDVLMFGASGALGQIFIFYTLSTFSSLLLVTLTVTRKMMTMILSVVWFGHRIKGMQWVGVGLVFGGIGAEGIIQRREKAAKLKAKAVADKKEL